MNVAMPQCHYVATLLRCYVAMHKSARFSTPLCFYVNLAAHRIMYTSSTYKSRVVIS